MESKFTKLKHRVRATHKKVILFLLMFVILLLLILGIMITLWYTFGEKLDQTSDVPVYVSTAVAHNEGLC